MLRGCVRDKARNQKIEIGRKLVSNFFNNYIFKFEKKSRFYEDVFCDFSLPQLKYIILGNNIVKNFLRI